jgi:thymidylate kinase
MARVYVLGGGGSGKTTLARRLGARLRCPVMHLDDTFFFPGLGDLPEHARRTMREARLRELAAREAWVMEGNFPGWLEELAARSDLIVWLDVPFAVAAWRIAKRHVLADLRGRNPHPGYRNLWRFLRRQRAYYTLGEAEYRRQVAANPDRWSGARYCRADVSVSAPCHGDRVLRLSHGSPAAAERVVLARLGLTTTRPDFASSERRAG